jgi:cytochrome c
MTIGNALKGSGAILFGLSLSALVTSSHATDATAGQAIFKSQCAICHSPMAGKNMTGPSLFGVVGRKSGSIAGFHYSPANQKDNLTWDEATLEKYLASPKTVVPGTTMTYAGLKDDTKRADLIAYLATLK